MSPNNGGIYDFEKKFSKMFKEKLSLKGIMEI